MIADTVEAATRAVPQLSGDSIRSIVEGAIEDKKSELQFQNCNFSRDDLIKIKKSLISSLQAIYHQRIQYPPK